MTTTSSSAARSAAPSPPSARALLGSSAAAASILGLVGFVVALLGSWNVSLWTDEAATIAAARRTPSQLWSLIQNIDGVHALYYFLIQGWTSLVGFSPVALRLPSAIAAGLSVAGVYLLARELGRSDVAGIAAVVCVILPRVTWMGIEARSFGPSAAVAVWATVILLHALRDGRWRWAVYAGLVTLGIALNVYVALLVVAHAMTVALVRGVPLRRRLAWLAAAAIGGSVASPVILLASSQRSQLGDIRASPATMLRRAAVNEWFLGETPTRVGSSNDGSAVWALTATVLAVLGWSLIALFVVGAIRSEDPASRRALAVLLPWALLPTVVVMLYSVAVSPLFNARYFTFCAPAAALLVGLGVGGLPRRPLRAVALVLIVALALPVYVSQRGATGKSGTDWSQVASYVGDHARRGDGVYFSPQEATSEAVVGRTVRGIGIAYPDDFEGLVDVTLDVPGPVGDTLGSTSLALSASASRLERVDRLWVIRPRDYSPAAARTETRFLSASGFSASTRWNGPVEAITEFVRR